MTTTGNVSSFSILRCILRCAIALCPSYNFRLPPQKFLAEDCTKPCSVRKCFEATCVQKMREIPSTDGSTPHLRSETAKDCSLTVMSAVLTCTFPSSSTARQDLSNYVNQPQFTCFLTAPCKMNAITSKLWRKSQATNKSDQPDYL